MKVYTKTGDDGTTGLLGGQRVSKSDPRIECQGAIDELNASLGLAAAACGEPGRTARRDLHEPLLQIQSDLFTIGSHITLPDPSNKPKNLSIPPLDEKIIARLESQIDETEIKLTPLRNFILPGGSESAARLHLSRTICRRAERLLVAFSVERQLPNFILIYLNRLSDWLFVHARLANHLEGVADVPWKPES